MDPRSSSNESAGGSPQNFLQSVASTISLGGREDAPRPDPLRPGWPSPAWPGRLAVRPRPRPDSRLGHRGVAAPPHPTPPHPPELHVAGEAELSATLHVEGGEVHAEPLAGLLEEVVRDLDRESKRLAGLARGRKWKPELEPEPPEESGALDTYLLRDGVIHGLCHLVHQPHEVLVENASAVQVVRPSDQVGQSLGGCGRNTSISPTAPYNQVHRDTLRVTGTRSKTHQ